jgi:hypothetical protein
MAGLHPLLLSYFLLGGAVLGNNGAFFPPLFLLCALNLLLLVRHLRHGAPAAPSPPRVLAGLVLAQGLLSLVRPPGPDQGSRPVGLFLVYLTVHLGLVAAAAWACLRPRQGDGGGRPGEEKIAALLLVLHGAAGLLTLALCPEPRIDVFVLQRQGAADLLAGLDPYRSTFPNIYDTDETARYFGAAALPRLTHYPYPPLSLYVGALAHLLGDVRLGGLFLSVLCGLLLFALARRRWDDRQAMAVLALYLLHPRGLFVVERAWTEPLIECAFVALLLAMEVGRPLLLAACLALFLSAKQYSVLALPLFFWSLPPRGRGPLLAGIFGAIVISAPLFAWDPAAFVEDVLLFQLQQPFREDALSLPAALCWLTGLRAPGGLALLAALGALVWCRRRMGPGAGGLALCCALLYFWFFFMAKQAFCNYYHFVGVLLLCGAAAPPAPSVERAR